MNRIRRFRMSGSAVGTASLYVLAFLLPVVIFCATAALSDVYPFGTQSFLTEDLKYQYFDFFSWYRDVLQGEESLFYSFSTSLGSNAWGLWTYYLASPLNLIILAFSKDAFTEAIFLITAIKLGLIGITSVFYLRHRFSIEYGESLALAVSFACSLWVMSQLRNPMWLDALILLPIVAHAVWQLVQGGGMERTYSNTLCSHHILLVYGIYACCVFLLPCDC